MRRRIGWATAAAMLLCFGGASACLAATPAAAEILDGYNKKMADLKTFEADFTLLQVNKGVAAPQATGHVVRQTLMKDGKAAGVLERKKSKTTADGAQVESLEVRDGEFLWMESRCPEMKFVQVYKWKMPAAGKIGGELDAFDLKCLGEDLVDGQRMWVLEGDVRKSDAADVRPEDVPHMKAFIGQKDSLLHRTVLTIPKGPWVFDTTYSRIKLNGDAAPALFKYTPPAGATVKDMSEAAPAAPEAGKEAGGDK